MNGKHVNVASWYTSLVRCWYAQGTPCLVVDQWYYCKFVSIMLLNIPNIFIDSSFGEELSNSNLKDTFAQDMASELL